ncbi:hypothetical protein GOV08_00610 [Candidatus Woesearchaeota archaeon]|nr:hypothetical protein [Candidatus Woesearchaeota archaeon]
MKKMAKEKIFNVPLRKEFQKAPKYKRAKKAVNALRLFLSRHMKSEQIKLSSSINLKLWERGIKNPPHHIKVTAEKDDEGIVTAELFGVKKETQSSKTSSAEKPEPKTEEKQEAKKTKKKEDKKVQSSGAASTDKPEVKKEAPKKEPKKSAKKK